MTRNMDSIDRWIRLLFVLAVGMLYLKDQLDGLLAAVLGLLSVVFLVTSLTGFCPLYSLLGRLSSGSDP